MHLVGENEAWIVPHRTAARYTLKLIERHKYFVGWNLKHSGIDLDILGGRKLYMNIRSPYTRIQSFWRVLHRVDPRIVRSRTFEEYVMDLVNLRNNNFDCWTIHECRFNTIKYPLYLTRYLEDKDFVCRLDKVAKFIRFEHLQEDLESVGLPCDLPKTHGWGERSELNLEWFDKHPDCIKVINKVYARDFRNFGYALL